MKERHSKIIQAIIRKSEQVCPDSLELIGLYGSAATGDVHPKSDLDLLILIRDEQGRRLTDTFILNDVEIGYDLYCTTWEMLERDAACEHAYLAKLMDARIVYVNNPAAVDRLAALRREASARLASDQRYAAAQAALDQAKKLYAECFLSDSLPHIRTAVGEGILYMMDALMLYHGRYFKKGTKRAFEELDTLELPFDFQNMTLAIISSETAEEIRKGMTTLLRTLSEYLIPPTQKAAPSAENLTGTYEEMFSNWRNKISEAVGNRDLYASFMNMVLMGCMMREVASGVDIPTIEPIAGFDPRDLAQNLRETDAALAAYEAECRRAGMEPKRYANLEEFEMRYLGSQS